MQTTGLSWTAAEKEIAIAAFQQAYDRETKALVEEIQAQVTHLSSPEHLWRLHDYLSARRHDIDGKYDSRDPALLFAFSQLVKEGWLGLEDLEGLSAEKLKKVAALSRM